MSTCLVTGGAGFIGSHVAELLLKADHKVVVMDDLSGGYRENIPAGALRCLESITRPSRVDRLFDQHRFDYVFHLAAYAAENLSHHIPRFNYENNVVGSINIINACVTHKVKHLVYTSSIAVYGHGNPPFQEHQTPDPIDPYGIAKMTVERHIECTEARHCLRYTIFRPFNVFGPRQNYLDRYRNVVAIFMRQAMLGRPLTIFGHGEQKRAFSYIGDVAPRIVEAIKNQKMFSSTFNVGRTFDYTVNDLADMVLDITASKSKVKHLPGRHEVTFAYADTSRIKTACDFDQDDKAIAKHYLRRALESTFAWMQTIPREKLEQEPSYFADIEIPHGLPPSWRQKK